MKNHSLIVTLVLLSTLYHMAYAVSIGDTTPDFKLPQVQGNHFKSLSDFHGKVVYLDFWASWCAPCRKSFPLMNTLYHKYKKQGLEVVAINMDEEDHSLQRFLQKSPVDFTLLRDQQQTTAEKFQVAVMPSSFLIDRSGHIRYIHQGFKTRDINIIEQHIQKLLAH